jgi:hypothetical protein
MLKRSKVKGKMQLAGIVTKDGEFIPLEMEIRAFIPSNPKDREPYTKVYGEKVLEVLRTKRLRGSELNVFLWFIGKNDWGNEWIPVNYKKLANELNISVITVKKAIKTLLELKWLIQFSPRQTVFRLNPEFVYRGGIISKIQTEKEIETLNLESETIDEFVDKATKSLKEETS